MNWGNLILLFDGIINTELDFQQVHHSFLERWPQVTKRHQQRSRLEVPPLDPF